MAVRRGAAAALLPTLCLQGVAGITTSGDPNSADFVVQPTAYPYFVSVGERGSCAGAVIGQRYVATAAHCLCPTPSSMPVIFSDGSSQLARAAYFNPDCMFSCDEDGPNRCDAAVLEFVAEFQPAVATPIDLYASSDEVGQEITILGYGRTGDAASGTCVEPDGKMRRAKNVVTAVEGSPGGVVKYVMDENGVQLEGMAQDGDSGGPAVISVGGVDYLAGVNSGTDESNPCDYGSVDQYCRISAHESFIRKVLDPNDNTIPIHIDFESASIGLAQCVLSPLASVLLMWLCLA